MSERIPAPIILSVKNGMFEAKEIVFCKDCKHWFYFWESEKHHCTESDKHPWDCPIREEDDFCSRGEKR